MRVPLTALFAALSLFAAAEVHAAYAIAQYGQPKYPSSFTHFDYVNPNAPKGGTLVLGNPDRLSSFDKFNPFTLRGNQAPGIDLIFETLAVPSQDEPATIYGLLADDIRVAANGMSVTFHVNPAARFSNGDPVTAADVKYSFDTLMSAAAAPTYRLAWRDITGATVIDRLTVRFDFRRADRGLPLLAGGIPVFSPKWGVAANGKRTPFDALAFETPIGSGPYVIERYSGGDTMVYRRNPNYWAINLPVRRGMYNFDHIVYKLYGDSTARLEAFKAGEFDAIVEYRARNWARAYVGKRFNNGEIVKGMFAHHNAAGMQGFFMNTRRTLFKDPRVREALGMAFDFEWLNRQLFYNQYRRIDSFFENSDLAATGLPSQAELKLLEPLRNELDPAVLGPMVTQPVTTPPSSLRENQRQARALLAQAGWVYRDGALRNKDGTPFTFELLDDSGGGMAPVAAVYARNLAELGITLNFRTTDFALLQKRLNDFDFDMTALRFPDSQTPGAELVGVFGSHAANTPGSNNLAGIAAPAVDVLINDMLRAQTREQLSTATRALDRVLMHGYYVVPQWYTASNYIAYRRTLAQPATLPLYYSPEDWIRSEWWDTRAASSAR